MSGIRADRRQVLAGVAGIGAAAVAGLPVVASAGHGGGGRERLSLDDGWRFFAGDIAEPAIVEHEQAYAHAKAGNAAGAAASDYDDAGWQDVTLPHDFALPQPYDRDAANDQGFRRRGIGWYRRTFALDEADRGRHLELQFGGIATAATIWLNGTLVHRSTSGYTGFTVDVTPFALYGDDLNTLAVRVDATASEGWWYEGAGIYRHVWLTKRHAVHVVTDGIHADPRCNPDGAWTLPVVATLGNAAEDVTDVAVEAVLIDTAGRPVARAATMASVPGFGAAPASLMLAVAGPALWSPDTPVLYTVRTTLRHGGETIDAVDTTIGFRTLRFDPDRGFLLNDLPCKIKGVCAHQDHAGVGVAVTDSLWDFRIRRLKAMGANALRTAHNPPAAELLDAADRLGILVMDETRLFNASEAVLPQLEWMVRRDRNHPSVILWSLCNEESLQSSEIGVAMIARMKALVRTLDQSRPVTAAMNGGHFATTNIGQRLDVVGFNYGIAEYDRYHAEHPRTPMISTEDGSGYMTRGDFVTDPARHLLASYDEEHTAWGASYRDAWKAIATRPFMAGGFLWTGFDYRGEPTPFEWPSASSSFGAMDLCGFAKTAFHIRRALWTSDAAVLELAPHWTWPGREGQPIRVMAISNAERVVLTLNGQHLADLAIDPFEMASCVVPYAPGRLEAIAYRGGHEVARTAVETSGAAVRLRLTPDRTAVDGDGRDAVPVTVDLLDAAGRPIPTAAADVTFAVTGGRILGLGNGDPNSHEPDQPGPDGARRRLYNGLAQVIVQAAPGARHLLLTAAAPGVASARTALAVRAVPPMRAVAAEANVQTLTEWRTSPASATRPDPREALADGDMNSWGWLKPGATQPPDPAGRFVRYRVTFLPRVAVRRGGGRVLFGRLAGRAEIWLDDRRIASKADAGTGRLAIPLPAGDRPHTLVLVFDAAPGGPPFGIPGTVRVEPI